MSVAAGLTNGRDRRDVIDYIEVKGFGMSEGASR
jgi:hypothetical protein